MSTATYEDVLEHARALVAKRYPRVYIGRPELHEVPPGTILGGSCWSAIRRARWILAEGLHLGDGVTQLDLARSWIELHAKLPLRRKHADRPPAWAPLVLFARPGRYEAMAYVDIRSAYRRILEIAGYDVEYRAGRWIGQGRARFGLGDLPKIAYSGIIAMSARPRSRVLRVTREHRLEAIELRNRYANVCLYTLARDVLHAVYSDAVRTIRSVAYANTDGYIVSERDVDELLALIAGWGFEARVKRSGSCVVRGTASFRFGDGWGTRRVTAQSCRAEPASPDFVAWLRARWSALAEASSEL